MIQQQQIAVPPHQFHHQGALDGLAGAPGKPQFHHPLPAGLGDGAQGQAPQAVLQLLGQGAAIPKAGWGGHAVNPGCLGLPTQLQPMDPLQAAQPDLDAVGSGLLGLLKAAGQEMATPFTEYSLEAGHIHWLQASLGLRAVHG